MKRRRAPAWPSGGLATLPRRGDGSFARGIVAAGCIAAFQDIAGQRRRATPRRVLRHALQGGTALAAGAEAANAFAQRRYGTALLACAAGAAGVYLIDVLLREESRGTKENERGQEA